MTKFLLAVHVIAAIVAIGPVTVAASMFPKAARRAASESEIASVRVLHRICLVYAAVGIVIPMFGLATANSLGVLGDAWLIISIVLTTLAAGVLALLVLPGQDKIIAELVPEPTGRAPLMTTRLAMYTGTFNLLWVVVTVLMIVRPGSTTGA